MARYCGEDEATFAAINGIKIGETQPCKESKGSWWEVFYVDGNITATVNTNLGISCGEIINEDELCLYVDDFEDASINLENLKSLSHV